MDKEEIRKALDHFENDEFVDAKEILKKEIRKVKNDHLKDKLGLKNDIEPEQEEPENDDTPSDDDDGGNEDE